MTTLQDWAKETGILPTEPTTERGAVSVVVDQLHEKRSMLWDLADYNVTSANGIVIWLVPISPTKCKNGLFVESIKIGEIWHSELLDKERKPMGIKAESPYLSINEAMLQRASVFC